LLGEKLRSCPRACAPLSTNITDLNVRWKKWRRRKRSLLAQQSLVSREGESACVLRLRKIKSLNRAIEFERQPTCQLNRLSTRLSASQELPTMPRFPIEPRSPIGAGARIEPGSTSQSECRVQAGHHNHLSTPFHIYVMPCRRGKRILGLGCPL
jgi:hypothetical protein